MKLNVQCPEEDGGLQEEHPYCLHGPTLLFYRETKADGFFACAAHRDKRHCNFQLSQSDRRSQNVLSKRYSTESEQEAEKYIAQRKSVFKSLSDGSHCHYCLECELVFSQSDETHKTHRILSNLNTRDFQDPTKFLPPLDNDKTQAQYFFDSNALKYFVQCFMALDFKSVICIGAPRLHAYIRTECKNLKSFLLDFDKRFLCFYEDSEYAWYNMCNNHFFLERQKQAFEQFVASGLQGKVLLFTDPPFGARTETVAHSLRQLVQLHNHLHGAPHTPLPLFWIFPYYAANYVQEVMPELQMCDYKVNYTNHLAYTNIGDRSRKLGSPVRIFTNVPLDRLPIPAFEKELYRNCRKCLRYVAVENQHCDKCSCCPSKNGNTYRHCSHCGVCVKPNYKHCTQCRRCVQSEGHNCQAYQQEQKCRICLRRGHIEMQCVDWRKHHASQMRRKGTSCCLICRRPGHNERKCPKRQSRIEELTFLGETVVLKIK